MTSGKRVTPEAFEELVRVQHNGSIILLTPYTRDRDPVQARCVKCDHEWSPNAGWLKRKTGCPNCAHPSRSSNEDDVVAKLFERFGTAVRMTEYRSSDVPAAFECEAKGHSFISRPKTVLRCVNPCPVCHREERRANPRMVTQAFRNQVIALTEKNYALYHRAINPNRYRRSKTGWHLDHIYSVHDAFHNPLNLKHPVTAAECAHPANLRLINYMDNHVKQRTSLITATELRRRIKAFDRLHGVAW